MSFIQFSQLAGMNLHYRMVALSDFFDSMEKHNIRNVELWGGSPHLYAGTATSSHIADIRKDMQRRNLNLVCYTPEQILYPFNIAAKEADLRKKSVDYFLRNIEIAAELGATSMLITSGWGYYTEPVNEAWQRSQESLFTLTRRAEELNITLMLEALQKFESNIVIDLHTSLKMLKGVQSKYLVGMIDTVAMAAAGDTIEDYHRELGEIPHIHLIDGMPSGHMVWGDGNLPLKDYLNTLSKINYRGHLTLELADTRYLVDPDLEFKRTLDYINHVYKMEM